MNPQPHDGALAIADAVPADSAGAREIGFAIPQTYNASRILFDNLDRGHDDRLALTGPLGTRSYSRALRGGLALGPRSYRAGAEARRSHPDVSRRHSGLSGGVLWRGPRRFCAAVDQYADAARSAAILPVGFECFRCRQRCRILHALQCRGLRGYGAADAGRGQRRGRRSRGAACDRRRTMAAGISRRAGGG